MPSDNPRPADREQEEAREQPRVERWAVRFLRPGLDGPLVSATSRYEEAAAHEANHLREIGCTEIALIRLVELREGEAVFKRHYVNSLSTELAALKAPQPDTEQLRARGTEQNTEQLEQAVDSMLTLHREWYRSLDREDMKGGRAELETGFRAARQALLQLFSRSTAPHQDSVRLAKIRAEGAQFVVTGRDIFASVPWPDGTRVIVAPLDWIDPNAVPTTPADTVE